MPVLPALLAATVLMPGLWEYQSSLVGSRGAPEQKCLAKAEVERFLTNPSNKHYDCDYTTRDVARGKVRLEGVCANRKHPEQKIGVSLRGDYSSTTIELKGVAKPRIVGLELPLAAAISAHRLGDCSAPPPAPVTPAPTTAAPAAASPAG